MPLLPDRSSLLPCALINIGIGARLWGGFLKILRKNYVDIIGDLENSAFQVGCSKSMKIKVCKEAAAPLAAEICAGSHHRLLRRQHCSSLCSQSEGHEHVANMASALGHDFVGFLAVFGRHNIRPPHFASKVSYSASSQAFAECSRSASCCYVATLFGLKTRKDFSIF